MLDYEILNYKITCYLKNGCIQEYGFSTEEAAKDFIIEHRDEWISFRLIKISAAIIDF